MPRRQPQPRTIGGSVPRSSNHSRAMQAQTRHSFELGCGYWEHDQPPVLHEGPVAKNDDGRLACDPPLGTRDGTRHLLAFGAKVLPFTWVASERAWAKPGGRRMAFTAEYLTREGWHYVGMVK